MNKNSLNALFGFLKRLPLLILTGVTSYSLLITMANLLDPFPPEIEYSKIILDKNGRLITAYLTEDEQWRMYTELSEITPKLRKAIIVKEDRFFYYHPGINPISILRAFILNMLTHRRTSGASTITMQVARLLNPKERTYLNKLKEMVNAFQLELKLSKDEILQVYLNLIPYGGNVQGIKSASVIYFEKMPNHLSLAEITTLSIIPNRPVSLRLGKNNEKIRLERNRWLNRFKQKKIFNSNEIDDAINESLNATRHFIPRYAPQLSQRLRKQYPNQTSIRSTIDLEMQVKAEKLVREYSNRLYFRNIKNATALIIENKSHKILAYIASADFNNTEDGGQVDGIQAMRSPGSTLKPLLYGLGFDAGIITPKSIITDVPSSFGGYEPENYDQKFNGFITVEEALARSLNIPAVKILEKIGTDKMIETLLKAEFSGIRKNKNNLGLSLILGGCGVNLQELGGLYSSIANQGRYYTIQNIENTDTFGGIQLISSASAYLLTQILTQLKRPDLPQHWDNSVHTPKLAWKTGTSYGRKDAWSIGYNRKYTIAVWVGNFSGTGVPEISGSEIATPLLFELFNAFDYDAKEEWFPVPENIIIRYVCPVTGKIPASFCSNTVFDYYIPGVSDEEKCDHLKQIFTNPDSTLSYCTSCRPEYGYRISAYPNIPPEMLTYYETEHIHYRKIPTHNPQCERLFTGSAPQITSPVNNNEYLVNILDSMEIMLSCNAANDVEMVYWFINNKFFIQSKPSEPVFFIPNSPTVNVSCSDDKGRNSNVDITVRFVKL